MEYDTPEKVAALGEMDPQLAEILKKMPLPAGRALVDAFLAKASEFTPSPETETEHIIQIPMRDGHLSPARVYHPPATARSDRSPLVVLIHGGGYCFGNNEQQAATGRATARLYGATCVAISYRLAPAHAFPAAPLDALDAVRWLAAHARDHPGVRADPAHGFVLAGGSSGGALSAVVAQKWLDDAAAPPVTGVWMLVAAPLHPAAVPERWRHLYFSREQNGDAPVLNGEALEYIKGMYKADVRSDLFAPVNSEGWLALGNAEKMPPYYLQVCGMDPVRDDGLVFEKMLREAGVKTRIDVIPGVPHGPDVFAAVGLAAAKKARKDSIMALGWLLGKEVSEEEVEKAIGS
uniref:Zinc finger DPH-type n=1 Tax=Neofusicoccum parvum TaxID=310453 RepID=A0ACB5SL44_9PEZI|nr:Zinc finger DPH-type [Neofusicoccum parvum]